MAVPSSGTLNQLGLAQECLNGTYGSGSISGRICLETLVTSGQCGSGSETYPAINTNSASHPNTSTPHEFSEFYGYDKDAVSAILRFRTCSTYGKGFFACFQTAGCGVYTAGAFAATKNAYTNSALTTPLGNGTYGLAGTTYGGTTSAFFTIMYGTGYISSLTPCSSDIRFKDNIELLGHSPSGINVYRFDYKNKKRFGDESWIGVLAHEVEHIPNVVEYIGGYQYVNYSLIDVDMHPYSDKYFKSISQ